MAASPKEMLEVYTRGAQAALPGTFNFKINSYSDILDIEDHFYRCFENFLTAGRIQWRHDLGDPRPNLEQALAVARRAAKVLDKLKEADLARQHFKFGSAVLVSYLLDGGMDPELLKMLPKFSLWRKYGGDYWLKSYTFPDVGVINALQNGKAPAQWDQMLEEARETGARRV